MTRIAISNQRPDSSTARPAALVFAAVLCCLNVQTNAQESARPSRPNQLANVRQPAADLEKDFWACDYVATTRGVGLDEGAMCGEVFEDLKRTKFAGDFRAMLSWWQKNRAAQHLALAAVSRTNGVARADQVTPR